MGWDECRKQRFEQQKKIGLATDAWKLSSRVKNVPAWDTLDEKQKNKSNLLMAIYAGMVTAMDRGIGQVLDTLKETGQIDNTIIFFLSDNGGCAEGGTFGNLKVKKNAKDTRLGCPDSRPMLGKAWANVNNTPFRLYKHHVHEGGTATPLIIHWPKGIKKERHGKFYRDPGHLIDIMPTCVELGKAEYPKEYKGNKIKPMEGLSLVPAFRGKPIKRDALYFEHEGHCAIRTENWTLLSLNKTKNWELYDNTKDRSELKDLAGKFPERVKEMQAKWIAWGRRADVLPFANRSGRKKASSREEKKKKKIERK